MIWIIGGTSETMEVVSRIRDKADYIVSVATYAGKEVLQDENVYVSRLNSEEMINFIMNKKIEIVLDLSHPYAIEVSYNAREACKKCGAKYLRYVRESSLIEGATYLPSLEECSDYLKTVSGCVFFTTGIKYINNFEKIRGSNRFVYRVLPSTFSIEECVKNKIDMKNIVAMLGPVSKDLNKAMFKDFNADFVVMKDSGDQGGTKEKILACIELNITPIVIGRISEEGIRSIDELMEMIK